MKASAPVLIIVLNWNGWADTRECLDSVFNLIDVDFVVAVIDNGSNNDCIEIERYGIHKIGYFTAYTKEDIAQKAQLPAPPLNSLVLIRNNENLGFARANNIGIAYAKLTGFEYVYLLNNDTTVEPDSLYKLITVLQPSEYCAVVPQIRYYHTPDIIWCCGGEINSFYEQYYFKDKNKQTLPDKKLIDITFATGCALLFKRGKVGYLSEKFFFGEEDYELSLRIRKKGLKMACIIDAVMYHKESASVNKSAKFLNKIYIHKLNRFIDIKSYAPYRWPFIIVYRSFKFFFLMLLVEKRGLNKATRYALRLCGQAFTLQEVHKKTFFEVLNYDLT